MSSKKQEKKSLILSLKEEGRVNEGFLIMVSDLTIEELSANNTASDNIKKQEGDYLENLLTYKLTLNKLDQNFQPRSMRAPSRDQCYLFVSTEKGLRLVQIQARRPRYQ